MEDCMPKRGSALLARYAVLAAAAVFVSLLLPVSPAAADEAAAPTCTAGSNRYTIWAPLAIDKYVTAELGYGGNLYGMVRAARTNPGPWEEWSFCSYWSGATKITYIKNEANDRYVSAELGRTGVDYGMLRARATSIGPWEKFKAERWGPNPSMYTLKSLANNRYVSVELGYGGGRHAMLRARATSIGSWEKMLIPCGVPYTCSF
jgi:hypothetical protein